MKVDSTGRPTMPSEFDWSKSFPEFFSQEEASGEERSTDASSGDASRPADVEWVLLLLSYNVMSRTMSEVNYSR